jgi:hypothetical protein
MCCRCLLGSVDVPRRLPLQAAVPQVPPPAPKPAGKNGASADEAARPAMPLGFTMGPEDLLVDDDGSPVRIDKAIPGTRRLPPTA